MFILFDPRAWRAYFCFFCSTFEHDEHINHVTCLLDRQARRAICVLRRDRVQSILTRLARLVTLNFSFKLSSRKYEKCLLRKTTIEHFLSENNFFFQLLNSCRSICVLVSFTSSRANNVCSTTYSKSVLRVLSRESLVILSFLLSRCEEFTKNEYAFETKCVKRKQNYNA